MGSESGKSERKRTEKPSTGIWKEGTGDQAGEKEETEEARAKSGTGKADVRRNQEEEERKNRRLSSRKGSRSDRKEVDAERKMLEARAEGKHLRNSCGSESGKGERKHTARLSTGTGKECTGNQAGKYGEDRRNESESGALRKPL